MHVVILLIQIARVFGAFLFSLLFDQQPTSDNQLWKRQGNRKECIRIVSQYVRGVVKVVHPLTVLHTNTHRGIPTLRFHR